MDREAALLGMRNTVGLWYLEQIGATALVYAACDLLVAGLDGPSLRMLAAVSIRHADEEVPTLLESALQEVDLAYYPKGSTQAQEAGLRVMASRVRSGTLPARTMAAWAHTTFGHDNLELAERFAELHDMYGTLDYIGQTREELDAEVRAEAQRILGSDEP